MDDVEAAYRSSASDSIAARKLGWTKNQVRAWRVARGLPPMQAEILAARDKEIMALWRQGVSSRQIAKKLGVAAMTVYKVLSARGLPPAELAARRASNVPSFDQRRWMAYCKSRNSTEAAEMIGDSARSFQKWMRRKGLPTRMRSRAYVEFMVTRAQEGDSLARRRCVELGVPWSPE